jgi:hypothetical protein
MHKESFSHEATKITKPETPGYGFLLVDFVPLCESILVPAKGRAVSFLSSVIRHQLSIVLSISSWRSLRLGARIGSADARVYATVEKAKHPASEKFFIPFRTRGYAPFGLCAHTEFRHDSCNTAPR